MKVAVFGGTGRIGNRLIQQCLDNGLQVVAPCRNPDNLKKEFDHENLEVVKASVFSAEELTPLLKGVDAVLSCLGPTGFVTPWADYTMFSSACKAAVEAMEANGITRYIMTSSASTVYDSKTKEPAKHKIIVKVLTVPIGNDLKRTEKYLDEHESINYTIFKATELKDWPYDPPKEDPILVEGVCRDPEDSYWVPRSMVARVMIDCISNEELYKKKMWVSMSKDYWKNLQGKSGD